LHGDGSQPAATGGNPEEKTMTRTAMLLLPALLLVGGCKADTTGIETLSVSDLVALRAAGADLVLCDANSPETRRRLGVIPGARLLSDYRDYAPERELPADKARRLVFYCHSEWCGAAVEAARKAIAAGHRDVQVLSAGIRGWVAAGAPVDDAS
jgi:rhodanese-related sulfurtransferase